ncbi:hypothetical protein MMC10_002524 [Thelotrema lepadinum]|nr:hypothetical protein [Thelotrema lepadinum]
MDGTTKAAPETQYQRYRVGLQLNDPSIVTDAFEAIIRSDNYSSDLIYACLFEAYRAGYWKESLSVLRAILDRRPGVGIRELALIRYFNIETPCANSHRRSDVQFGYFLTLEKIKLIQVIILKPLMRFASSSSMVAAKDDKNAHPLKLEELEWYWKISYRQAVDKLGHFLRIASDGAGAVAVSSDILQQRILVQFLGGTLLLTIARESKCDEAKTHSYRGLLNYGRGFSTDLSAWDMREAQPIFTHVASSFLVFRFEAAIQSQDWECAQQIVDQSKVSDDFKIQAMLGDLLLSLGPLVQAAIPILEEIFNNAIHLQRPDTPKLSRWIRCLFQSMRAPRLEVVKTLLNHACCLATKYPKAYPDEELEWLTVFAFNLAADCYQNSEDADCDSLVQSILKLTQLIDNASLLDDLTKRIETLRAAMRESCLRSV